MQGTDMHPAITRSQTESLLLLLLARITVCGSLCNLGGLDRSVGCKSQWLDPGLASSRPQLHAHRRSHQRGARGSFEEQTNCKVRSRIGATVISSGEAIYMHGRFVVPQVKRENTLAQRQCDAAACVNLRPFLDLLMMLTLRWV